MSAQTDKLAALTMRWNNARILALQLKRERNESECSLEVTELWIGNDHRERREPCWKIATGWEPDEGTPIRLPRDEWCSECQKREEIHLRLRPVVRTRGALMRAMQRCALTLPPLPETEG